MKEEKRKLMKVAAEKVANMVSAFLDEGSDSFHVSVTKVVSEKVTIMVGTFSKATEMVSDYQARKWNHKRLPIWWEPFERGIGSSQEPIKKTEQEKVTNLVGTF